MVLLSFGGGVWSWRKSEKSMGSGVAGGVAGRSPRSASSLVLSPVPCQYHMRHKNN